MQIGPLVTVVTAGFGACAHPGAKWLGSEFAKAENAVASALGSSHVNITIHRQN